MSQDTTANLSIVAKVEGTDRAASELDRVAAAGARAEAGANKATEALKGVGSAGGSAGSGLSSAANGAASAASGFSSMAATAGAAALGVGATVAAVGALANALIPVELAAQKLQKTLNFTNDGNIAAAAKELDYLRAASNRIGLEFNSTASAYVKFTAAAKGTAIEGETAKRVFEGLSKASVVLGLSADETAGALNALQQMVSKGTVQAEELRGQLGERLPGAFQIAARAMGVTTAELGKLLEQGKVTAEDMLPKLAAELEKTFGDSAKKAADDLQGQLNRMQNSWTEFKQIMSKAVLPLTVSVTAVAADALNGGNALSKEAKRQGWGAFGQGAAAFSGAVASAVGIETDPLQRRQNRLSDLYRQEQALMNKLAADAAGGISASGNGRLGGLFWREARIDELSEVRAKLAKINKEIEADFAASIKKASKSLGDAQTPEMWAKWQDEQDQKKKAALAGWEEYYGKHLSKEEKYQKALKELKEQAEKAGISKDSAQYRQAERDIRERFADKSTGMSDAMREAERQQERLNDLLEVGSGVSKAYTADVTLLGKALASGKITTEEYSSAASKLWKKQTEAGKAWEASADAADKANKALNVWKADHESQLAAITEETTSVGQNAAARKVLLAGMQVEADARKKIEQLSLNLSEADRAAAVSAINAERDKQKALVETALIKQQAVDGAYQLEQENRRFAADSILDERARSQAILDIESETWRQRIELAEVGSEERRRLEDAFQQWYSNQLSRPAIESMRKALESIDQTFHDSFSRMLENGKADWDAFGKALATSFKTAVADEIYKMTIRPLVVQVVGAFSGQPGVAGQAQGIGGVISNVQSAYAGVSGGISNAANSFALSGMGQYLGLSTAGQAMGPPTASGAMGYTASGATMTGAGSTLSAVATPATAALLGGYLMAEMAKAGWGMDNNRSAGGAYASNPYLYMAYQAGSRLFGHNRNISNDAAGIRGTFDLTGFSGEQYQERSQKGGTFRSDKRWTDTYDVSSDIDKELDSAFRKTVAKLQDMGKTLGVETSKSIDGFTHEFSLQLSENGDMSKAGEKLAAEIGRAADELVAKMVPNIDEFARLGESASQTFSRLNQEVTATDAILLAMGKDANEAFGAVGLASVKAREDLIDLAGGLDALASKTQSFYANFYSSEEQVQLAAKQAQKVLTEGFAEIGQGIPATREAFRALVESQDLSTEAGRKLWNSLLDLQDEFDAVADGADATATSMKAAADKLAAATTTAQQGQASLFDTFASDAQKLDAARKIVNDTFASIGKAVPESAGAFLSLAQSLDPAIAANQEMIAALAKAKDAFAYVRSAADNAAIAADNAAIAAAQSAADSTASQMEALASAIGSVADPVQTLTDKVSGLRDKLGASYSKEFGSGVSGLNSLLGWRSSLSDARGKLTSAIDAAQLRLPGADVGGILRGRESALWDKLRSASVADQPKIAQQIEALFTQRLSWQADQDKAGRRNQLEESYKLATGTLTAQQDALQVQRTALGEQISAMQKLTDISHRLRDTVTSMAVDGLSSLSPAAQVQAARQAFEVALSQAKSGDSEAASKLGELGNAYRQAGRTFYASSTDYANIDSSVRGALASMADVIDKSSQISAAQLQLTALDAQAKAMEAQGKTLSDSYTTQSALLDATVNTAAEEIALLTRLNDTLSASDSSVKALIATQLTSLDDLAQSMQRDGLSEVLAQSLSSLPTEFASQFVQYAAPSENRDLLRQQLDAAKQQLEDEKARYSGLVAMHNEQMEQLKALNARLRAIENNGALAGAGG